MLPPRAGLNLASTFARTTVFRRTGHQLAGRSYAKSAAPIRSSSLLLYAGLAGAGIGLHAYNLNSIYCDKSDSQRAPPPVMAPPPTPNDSNPLPPPASSLDFYELTFGSVCGICAGVFIKKGAKLVAFLLGGTFVLLQYLGSASIIRVDWSRAASRFENLFYRTENGVRRAPSIGSLWTWLVNFLAADFQPRATFTAGLLLGLRVG
ncbi:FUN14 family-domain-containing protein [Thelephora terrestris]|uniref:FUN14 family-domain-containing protein n=1 Tax=Thelephora terrestris TaxID=56493 RepID=A0A9P6LCP6_9AGAM|nr:FUN14 family-domain-containing protein [Thelephora terrestris]